jgi:hypothetical protein
MRSIAPHASARSCGFPSSFALAIAWLIAGSSSCGQFVLLSGTMLSPLKLGSRSVWPSEKSALRPTFGHTATFIFGTLQ